MDNTPRRERPQRLALRSSETPEILVSLIVSTLGRTIEINRLLSSIQEQDYSPIEVIIVDQNGDDRLAEIVKPDRWRFPLCHVLSSGIRGSSRGRNLGVAYAKGQVLLFPDDDCWYPAWFLKRGVGNLQQHHCASVAGRAADEKTKKSINGRFETRPMWVNRRNVWTTQIEWTVFIRKDAFCQVNGYDENLGVGAQSPWGACEGNDLTLRLLLGRFRTYYDPELYAYHDNFFSGPPDSRTICKGRAYARGFGYVLRRHGYGPISLSGWVARSVVRSLISLAKLDRQKFSYYVNVTVGRLEGWLGTTFTS